MTCPNCGAPMCLPDGTPTVCRCFTPAHWQGFKAAVAIGDSSSPAGQCVLPAADATPAKLEIPLEEWLRSEVEQAVRERDEARAQVETLTRERDAARDGASAAMTTAGDVVAEIIGQRDAARAETARYAALIQGPLAVKAQDLRKELDAALDHLRAVVASHDCRHDGTPRDRVEDCPFCAARDAAAAFLAARKGE